MKRLLLPLLLLLGLGSPAGAQTPPYGTPPILRAPTSGLTLTYTTGTVTVGGWQKILPAGSVTVADNQVACNAPQFPACNFIYWAGPGTDLAATTSPTTAYASGVALIAFVSTSGGVVTNIVYRPTSTQMVTAQSVGALVGLRLPLCNTLLQQGCQLPVRGSLSGY